MPLHPNSQLSTLNTQHLPVVSVLMPIYNHAAFVGRALESLWAQTFADWELVVVDDGSTDVTDEVLNRYRDDPRVSLHRRAQNGGLGAALNDATAVARGRYLAYLPADDVFYPDHLARLVALLEARADVVLAFGGVRYGYKFEALLARMSEKMEALPPEVEGEESIVKNNEADAIQLFTLHSSYPRLVQVMHRRFDPALQWPTREEIESDRLEADFWQKLLARGAAAYAGAVSCEWVEHFEQRHKIISSNKGGLSRYRHFYGLGTNQWVNWQPTHGIHLDERARYQRFSVPRDLPAPGGLKILLVGELGFNPERIMAFEERGHKLFGLWVSQPEPWDTTGPLPFGNVEDIAFGPDWVEQVRAAHPDVIYAGINWQALPLVEAVLDAKLGIPLVFHFKEGPFIAHEQGLWRTLIRALTESDAQVYLNHEAFRWFQLATHSALDFGTMLILDGDLPKADWFTDDWTPKLRAQDNEIHTVCPGRPLGLDPFDAIARAGIHVHFYGRHFQRQFPTWTKNGLDTGYMHLHPAVEPADWTRELSQYDAAWFHVFESNNGGDLRRARWDDLNLPARLGTYAAAGLPWILKDNRDSHVAVQELARRHDIGVFFQDFDDLAAQLRDRARLAELDANARASRMQFAFDTHVDALVALFHTAIARRGAPR